MRYRTAFKTGRVVELPPPPPRSRGAFNDYAEMVGRLAAVVRPVRVRLAPRLP
jgi:hypothetical protein